jgi:hypothetical protein
MVHPDRFAPLCGLLLLLATSSIHAGEDRWQTSLDLRYRLELVDDSRFAEDATASTLRARVGLTSPDWSGWRAGLTAHANRAVGIEDYNATANGLTEFPVVADPDDEGISEAWLEYAPVPELAIRAGRQRLIEDNARFLGNVGFRQLEQTFDAVTLGLERGTWQVDLRWLDKAHRIFGPSNPDELLAEAELDTWMATVAHPLGDARLAFYAQRIVYDDRPASHRNLGFRLTGPLPAAGSLNYRVEYARQAGIEEREDVATQDYLHVRLAQRLEAWHWFAGHERLGGDGSTAFQTPLATLHAFNGWSDQFLSTPPDGLVDTYLAAGRRLGDWTGLIKLHDFRRDHGSGRYGREFGAQLQRPLGDALTLSVKAALFEGDDGRPDVTKTWFTLNGRW